MQKHRTAVLTFDSKYFDDLSRADFGTVSAAGTFGVIDHSKVIDNMDCIGGALSLALCAGYASDLAALYDECALSLA